MYEFILREKFVTAVAGLLLAVLASATVGSPRLWWRGTAFSFAPALATAFFLVAPLSEQPIAMADILGGLLLEFTVLCLFFVFFKQLRTSIQRMSDFDTLWLLRASILIQLLLAWPLVGSAGFGIFSEGSRIDYLYAGSLGKYLTYGGFLLTSIQAALVAQRISQTGNPGLLGSAAIVTAFVMSVLAGSKGGVFLWLLAIAALVDYRRARISVLAKILALGLGAIALIGSSLFVSDFLGITPSEFIDIALSRFFLNNDARALAFDFRSSTSGEASLLAESFRSLWSLFGVPPQYPPLGIQLYGQLFGVDTGNGANASLAALLVYYTPAGYVMLTAVIATAGALALALIFEGARRAMRRASSRVLVLVFALFAVQQYSQDFLAFQVVMPLAVIAILIIWLYDHTYVHQNRKRSTFVAATSHRQHHHSSA